MYSNPFRSPEGRQTTASDGLFSLSLAKYSVLIKRVPSEHDLDESDTQISLVDPTGAIIDVIRDEDCWAHMGPIRFVSALLQRISSKPLGAKRLASKRRWTRF